METGGRSNQVISREPSGEFDAVMKLRGKQQQLQVLQGRARYSTGIDWQYKSAGDWHSFGARSHRPQGLKTMVLLDRVLTRNLNCVRTASAF